MAKNQAENTVPDHLQASVIELAGALAEDWPDHSHELLMEAAAATLLEQHEEERLRLVAHERRVLRWVGSVLVVLMLASPLVGQLLALRSASARLDDLGRQEAELLSVVPDLVERQSQLVEALLDLGADTTVVGVSGVPTTAPLDEQLELAIDLQRTLDIEHAAVVPQAREQRVKWAQLDDELHNGRNALRAVDARLELIELRMEETRAGWWGGRWLAEPDR